MVVSKGRTLQQVIQHDSTCSAASFAATQQGSTHCPASEASGLCRCTHSRAAHRQPAVPLRGWGSTRATAGAIAAPVLQPARVTAGQTVQVTGHNLTTCLEALLLQPQRPAFWRTAMHSIPVTTAPGLDRGLP